MFILKELKKSLKLLVSLAHSKWLLKKIVAEDLLKQFEAFNFKEGICKKEKN